jgi:hypothetical protein
MASFQYSLEPPSRSDVYKLQPNFHLEVAFKGRQIKAIVAVEGIVDKAS